MIAIPQNSRRIAALALALPLAFSLSACSVGLSTSGGGETDNTAPASQHPQSTAAEEPAADAPESSVKKANDSESDKDASKKKNENGASPVSNNVPTDVVASWQGMTDNGQVRLDINSVVVKDGLTQVTLTGTNIDSSKNLDWATDWGGMFMLEERTKLFDPKSRLSYSAGETDGGDCLCTTDFKSLEPGQSQSAFVTFQGLPEGVDKVNIVIEGLLPFEDVPVTRK